ncbi:aminoacylase [Synergistales bacterium]|nr:aminoacylase [Synergistales bacterium]
MYDLIVKNGIIVDGTGSPWYRADVAVKNEIIAGIGKFAAHEGKKVLDANGLIVTPGFIDTHTHTDIVATAKNDPENSLFQGVTTQVSGNCGKSNAPVNSETIDLLKRYLDAYTPKGIVLGWNWKSMGDWFDIIDRQGFITDIAALLGQGTVRLAVLGMSDAEPTKVQLEEMKKLVDDAMREGTVGMSSGLIYPPGIFTKTGELIELCRVVKEHEAVYTTHLRSEGNSLMDAVEEAIEIGRESGCKVHISHHKVRGGINAGLSRKTLAAMEYARGIGIDVTCDLYPYVAGYSQISSLVPRWATVGGVNAMLERLANVENRDRFRVEMEEGLPDWDSFIHYSGWDGIAFSSAKEDHSVEGKSIAQLAAERNVAPIDALLSVILKEKAEASVIIYGSSLEDRIRIMRHPLSMIGSDGFACSYTEPRLQGKPHPRCLSTFPRVLAQYVREEHVLDLETAIYKMSGFAASRFGFTDRGLVKKGLLADFVVFDYDKIADKSTFDSPYQKPAGIRYVIKNGVVLIEDNIFNGQILGKSVRLGNR